jgi:DNA-binding FadR family transcriptional regulator
MDAATGHLRRLKAPTGHNVRNQSEAHAQAIIDDVVEGLAKGVLKTGDRLPDERSLCVRYGAGRHTVRKALNLLVDRGVVGRHVGRGSFITMAPATGAPEQAPAGDWSLLELTEARLLLEPGLATLVLERADATDFARLQDCISGIERARDWREFKEAKYAFHRALALATRNRFMTHVFDLIISARRDAWKGHYYRVQDMIAARDACLEETRAILAALLDGDAERASETIRQSITRIIVTIGAL